MASRGVNKVILVGNLGKDPEVRYTTGGDCIASISIATSETWKDKATGEMKEQTEWHRVSAFGKLAEIMERYLRKGSKVYVEGSLRTRSYEKDGQKRFVTEIRCNELQMLDGKGEGESDKPESRPQRKESKSADNSFDDFDDQEIPF